jgi:ArsR family transcriptional regulator, lead/cadmium/zinc/bismuth-responsive transcriptional repressor
MSDTWALRACDPERVGQARAQLGPVRLYETLERLHQVLCTPPRLQLLVALHVGTLSVGDLALVVERTVSATSQHLRVLRQLGLVETERQHRFVYYHLRACQDTILIQQILDLLKQHVE